MKESASREDFGIAIRSALLKKGTKQKFSLLALLIISIIFFSLERVKSKPINVARAFIHDVIYIGSMSAQYPNKFFSYSSSLISKHFNVYDENIKLQEELAKYKSLANESKYLKVENKILKTSLDDNLELYYDTVTAKIMIDENSPYLKSLIINKGKNKKILKGMPVLGGSSLIGKVVESNFISSRVLLLNDLNSKVPVIVEPSGHHAILSGKGTDKPVLQFLPENNFIADGNIVYTSGKDGVLNAGIDLGKVSISSTGVPEVNLFIDPNQLNYANVVIGITNN